MSLWQRLEIAYSSQFGGLLLIFAALLTVLCLIYVMLRFRQKRQDRLAYLFSDFYEGSARLMTRFKTLGQPRADFFGRRSFVVDQNQMAGVALIPPPDLFDNAVLEKWNLYLGASHQIRDSLFPKILWTYSKDRLVLVEGELSDDQGMQLSSLRHLLLDQKLVASEKERLLLNVAEGLAHLHAIKTENGCSLYHGWLLPSSFFVQLDAYGKISRLLLAYTGIGFSLGSKRIQQRLQTLQKGKLPIEKFRARELLEEIDILSPEQQNAAFWHQVGKASDFYQYGGLALKVLSDQYPSANVKWDKVPDRWRPFLQQCLNKDRNERPRDFLQLKDWLDDPEIALTHREFVIHQPSSHSQEAVPQSLSKILDEWHQEEENSSKGEKFYFQALTALRSFNWKLARSHLEKSIKADGAYAPAYAQMAIVLYEMEKYDEAEKYYSQAKSLNPAEARRFREHIALKI